MTNLVRWLEERRDCCFELLRMYLGAGLLTKGVLFAGDPGQMATYATEGRLDAQAAIIAHYVVVAHVMGGVLLFLGLLTRLAALVNVPVLLGAVVFVHQREGLFTRTQGMEFALLVLFTLVLIVWHGPGRWSLDRVLFQKGSPAVPKSRERIA